MQAPAPAPDAAPAAAAARTTGLDTSFETVAGAMMVYLERGRRLPASGRAACMCQGARGGGGGIQRNVFTGGGGLGE